MEILGTDYKIIVDKNLIDQEGADGLCEPYAKRIRIMPEQDMLDDTETKEEKRKGFEQTLRHEIIHAFFYESGVIDCGDERLVEWLSVQIPKMYEVFKECGCAGDEG